MTRLALALASTLTLAMGGCAISYPPAPQATPSPISSGRPGPPTALGSPTPAVRASPGGPSAEIEISITSGPHAGSYRAVAPGGCDSKPTQNRFTVTYADDAAPDGFVALHLVLRDAALALQDESGSFVAEISVGGAGAGISYTIDPRGGLGDGTVLLERTPFQSNIELSARAADDSVVDLSIICSAPAGG